MNLPGYIVYMYTIPLRCELRARSSMLFLPGVPFIPQYSERAKRKGTRKAREDDGPWGYDSTVDGGFWGKVVTNGRAA